MGLALVSSDAHPPTSGHVLRPVDEVLKEPAGPGSAHAIGRRRPARCRARLRSELERNRRPAMRICSSCAADPEPAPTKTAGAGRGQGDPDDQGAARLDAAPRAADSSTRTLGLDDLAERQKAIPRRQVFSKAAVAGYEGRAAPRCTWKSSWQRRLFPTLARRRSRPADRSAARQPARTSRSAAASRARGRLAESSASGSHPSRTARAPAVAGTGRAAATCLGRRPGPGARSRGPALSAGTSTPRQRFRPPVPRPARGSGSDDVAVTIPRRARAGHRGQQLLPVSMPIRTCKARPGLASFSSSTASSMRRPARTRVRRRPRGSPGAEHRHHRIPYELLHGAPVTLDHIRSPAWYGRMRARTSSGSAPSAEAVKPTRSQKSTDTTFRSSRRPPRAPRSAQRRRS